MRKSGVVDHAFMQRLAKLKKLSFLVTKSYVLQYAFEYLPELEVLQMQILNKFFYKRVPGYMQKAFKF